MDVQHLLFYLAAVTLLVVAAMAIESAIGNRSVKFLKDIHPIEGGNLPKVSVVIAARNEQRNLEAALQSVLSQDYPNFEIIVVNDRSTDDTGKILEHMAQSEPRLQVCHVTELPKGWLGKTHALQHGSEMATGEYFLFTDADVVMESTVISRAMAYVTEQKVDHLAIGPRIAMDGVLLNVFATGFLVFFSLFVKPWKVSDPKSNAHVGIGAFNLVRAQAYHAAGTHRAIAMRPDDDLKLGKLIKKHGFRQHIMAGHNLLHVEWYSSVRELVNGLMKNFFAGVDYNLAVVLAATVGQLLFFIWPFGAVFATSGWTQLLNGVVALVLLTHAWHAARINGIRPIYSLGFPLASVMFLYILWRSTLMTIFNDGINWRGTHYSLADLKANKV